MLSAEATIVPQDEYMHTPTDHPQFNESAYYQFYDASQTYYLVRMGNRVNEGHAELTILAFFPDGSAGFRFDRVPISDNSGFDAGGLRFDVIEPLRKTRVRYSGPLHMLASSFDLELPAKEFTKAPVRQLTMDLEYTTLHVYEGLNHEPGDENADAMASTLATGHFRGPNSVTGVIGFDGELEEVRGFGFRDHSWGPRQWNSPNYWRWISGIADQDNWFEVLVMKVEGHLLPDFGVVCENGNVRFVDKFDITSTYSAETPHYPETVRLTLHHPDGDVEVTGEALRVAPLRHRKGDEVARIAEVIFRCELAGFTTHGFAEYHDRMLDGVPEGMGEV
ncbi:hypothetical protein [Georgenia sp. SYP-B2076]|uniref:DUF7064 domain-containing protein n=1 Tax=Georgenia sp. SYP-B2076 TaxID=2495881 RepID=UPI000F8D5EAF|nr:hypothetical protein [Georgenia sp. SYP-B2076]